MNVDSNSLVRSSKTMDWETFVKQLLGHMGFTDFRVETDVEHNHGAIFIYDYFQNTKEEVPDFIESLNHLLQLVAKKHDATSMFFDLNSYRKEREHLITELARTAARKVTATKQELSLPAMNSYERRLVHMELAMHPDIKTESSGTGWERFVTIKPL